MIAAAVALAFCVPGYATAHRPPWAFTAPVKRHLLHGRSPRHYILDHIVPIELGGDPFDTANLQLQTRSASLRKDRVENRLHRQVCSGRRSLAAAQARMRAWR